MFTRYFNNLSILQHLQLLRDIITRSRDHGHQTLGTFRGLRLTAEEELTDGYITVGVHDISGHPTTKRRLRKVPITPVFCFLWGYIKAKPSRGRLRTVN